MNDGEGLGFSFQSDLLGEYGLFGTRHLDRNPCENNSSDIRPSEFRGQMRLFDEPQHAVDSGGYLFSDVDVPDNPSRRDQYSD